MRGRGCRQKDLEDAAARAAPRVRAEAPLEEALSRQLQAAASDVEEVRAKLRPSRSFRWPGQSIGGPSGGGKWRDLEPIRPEFDHGCSQRGSN